MDIIEYQIHLQRKIDQVSNDINKLKYNVAKNRANQLEIILNDLNTNLIIK